MKILQIKMARAAWIFKTNDMNPHGKDIREMLPELVKRYNFANIPDIPKARAAGKGIPFGSGTFQAAALDVTMYDDGLIADTRHNTKTSNAFLEDVMAWATKTFGLVQPAQIRKAYASELFVELDKPLDGLVSLFGKLAKELDRLAKPWGHTKFSAYGITLASDPDVSAQKVPPFKLERADETPHVEGRYYSAAPVHTEEHVKLLDMIERAIA